MDRVMHGLYIYIALKDGAVYAATTRKYELAAWLDKNTWTPWDLWCVTPYGEIKRIRCPQDTHNTGRYEGVSSPTDAIQDQAG